MSPAMNTRRQFLIRAPLGFLVTAAACRSETPAPASQSTPATPGAPPTFGTRTGSGPDVTPATFAEAEKLMQVTMTPAERQQAAGVVADTRWRRTSSAAPGRARSRSRPTDAPATLWNPMLPGIAAAGVARSVRAIEG